MALSLVCCKHCNYPQMTSADLLIMELEIQCENCYKYFQARDGLYFEDPINKQLLENMN